MPVERGESIVSEVLPTSTHESVNASTLEELRELTTSSGDAEQFDKLIKLFLKELESGIASMHEALAERNAGALAEFAHGLKGACASMGAGYLASLCNALEKASGNAEFEGVEARVKAIASEIVIVREKLKKEISA
jgi:HPt (histidine-containing phosphotransfer) domain-containing protein